MNPMINKLRQNPALLKIQELQDKQKAIIASGKINREEFNKLSTEIREALEEFRKETTASKDSILTNIQTEIKSKLEQAEARRAEVFNQLEQRLKANPTRRFKK